MRLCTFESKRRQLVAAEFNGRLLDECPGNLVKSGRLEKVDLVVVSHAAFDHLGDTERIAEPDRRMMVCGGEVRAC